MRIAMYNSLKLFLVIFIMSGCSMMIGNNDYACGSSEDLKDAGICGSTEYIRANLAEIEKVSYKGMRKINGAYFKCEEDDDECLKKIESDTKEVRW